MTNEDWLEYHNKRAPADMATRITELEAQLAAERSRVLELEATLQLTDNIYVKLLERNLAAEREKVVELNRVAKQREKVMLALHKDAAAAQATIEQMREALMQISHFDGPVTRLTVQEALALPTNQDALHEARAQECERLAKFCSDEIFGSFLYSEAAMHRAKKEGGKCC